ESDLDQIEAVGKLLSEKLAEAMRQAQTIESALGLPPIKTFADVSTMVAIASVISRSPGAPMSVLSNDAWNTPPADARSLIERGRKTNALRADIEKNFTPAVLDQDPSDGITYVERKTSGIFGF